MCCKLLTGGYALEKASRACLKRQEAEGGTLALQANKYIMIPLRIQS